MDLFEKRKVIAQNLRHNDALITKLVKLVAHATDEGAQCKDAVDARMLELKFLVAVNNNKEN